MTREEAVEIARRCAKAKPQSYYAEPFEPHEWVVDAILEVANVRGAKLEAVLGAAVVVRGRRLSVKTQLDHQDRTACDALNVAVDQVLYG